jgi:glycosyltransferase involved in cell wall biosynthesis
MRKRILFVYNVHRRFVDIDRALLSEQYDVQEWYQPTRWVNLPALFQAVRRCDLVFCWFASWHALMPVWLARLLGKPAHVHIGGYDVARVPAAGYGSQRGGLRKAVSRAVIHSATTMTASSDFLRSEAINNSGADPKRITTLYLGIVPVSPNGASPQSLKKQDLILTVGGIWRENLLRKGLLPFVRAAKLLPDLSFVLAGDFFDSSVEVLKAEAAPNVKITGHVSDEKLGELYNVAKVYVQASLHEGFGMSVGEAMLAGCIPVVTHNGSLPEVVGDAGVYAASNDPGDIAIAIRQALTMGASDAEAARKRVLTHFSLDQRRQLLFSLMNDALARASSRTSTDSLQS